MTPCLWSYFKYRQKTCAKLENCMLQFIRLQFFFLNYSLLKRLLQLKKKKQHETIPVRVGSIPVPLLVIMDPQFLLADMGKQETTTRKLIIKFK